MNRPDTLPAPRPFRSSATQLAMLYVAICALCVGGLLWVGFLVTQRALEREVDLVIETELDGLKEQYDEGGIDRLADALDRRADSWGRLGAVYLLVDSGNNRIAGNLTAWPPEFTGTPPWLEFDIVARERNRDVDHPVRAEVYDLGTHRLVVGTDISERRRISRRLRATAIWGTALAAALSALIGWWYSRRVAARVRGVAKTCETIISGDLARRLPLAGNRDEFDQLAGAVNHMLDRVEQQTVAVRATFNSAAHDLRSPLHRIRVRLETALHHAGRPGAQREAIADTIGDTVADLERVQRTLTTLLQIAQADAAAGLATEEPVDLAALVRELVELYAPEARERGLGLKLAAIDAAVIRGNRQLLAQLLANLLENAIKYVPRGGHIEVELQHRYQRLALCVRDDGPGIPEESRQTVLQPFHRLERDDNDTGGSGLGLSLVASVARLHRARLTLSDHHPGLAVCCEFTPQAAADAPLPAAPAASTPAA